MNVNVQSRFREEKLVQACPVNVGIDLEFEL